MFLKIINLFCHKGKHIWLRMEVRAPGSTVLCSISYRALFGQFIYTRQRTESSVNYIRSIRHYNCPKYNSQLVALEPLTALHEQCENEGYFNESWHQNNRYTTGQPSSVWAHTILRWHHISHITPFWHATVEKAVKYDILNTQWVLWEDKFVSLLSSCHTVFLFLSHSSETGHQSQHHVYS